MAIGPPIHISEKLVGHRLVAEYVPSPLLFSRMRSQDRSRDGPVTQSVTLGTLEMYMAKYEVR